MKTQVSAFAVVLAVALCVLTGSACAQLISYEPFTGLTVGPGITGSGTGATGWTDTGWSGGTDPHFQTVAPVPSLTYQISGGAYLNGGNTALELTTSPLPVPAGLLATRNFPPQNTTLFFSFLLRPVTIGNGTDSIQLVNLSDGVTTYGQMAILPDQGGTYFVLWWLYPNGGIGGGTILVPGQTYLIVAQFARPLPTSGTLAFWINPTATYSNPLIKTSVQLSSTATVSQIGLGVSSANSAGPTSTVIVDELRIGYTWADVVPPAPVQLVPTVNITSALNLSWQTQSGKNYQPQYSYDLTNWFNLGSSISGNGQMKSLFDSTDSTAKKFYRILIQ